MKTFLSKLRSNFVSHDALTVLDEKLKGASDDFILKVCRREKRIFITLDLDFADIVKHPPEQFSGLMVLRVRKQNKRNVLKIFEKVIPSLKKEPISGKLWVIDGSGFRIR